MRHGLLLALWMSLTSGVAAAAAPVGDEPICEGPAPAPAPVPEPGLPACPPGKPCVAVGSFTDDVAEASVRPVIDFIREANLRQVVAIVLEINSDGGDVDAGFLLARAIENSSAPVVCIVDGEAMSMAFYILQSCDSRLMTFRSALMTHEVRLAGETPRLRSAATIQNELSAVRVFSRAFAEHVSRRMKMTYSEYNAHVRNGQDWYLNHEQAVKSNAVDKVVSSVTEAMALLADELSQVSL